MIRHFVQMCGCALVAFWTLVYATHYATQLRLIEWPTGSMAATFFQNANTRLSCQWGVSFSGDAGTRRIALLVGVNNYRSQLDDLPAATQDLIRVRKLLVDKNGFGFSEENVCVLTSAEASRGNFEKRLKDLKNKAGPGDRIVIYFSGHGIQLADDKEDEPDKLDEFLYFYPQNREDKSLNRLRDDDFNGHITELYEQVKFSDPDHNGQEMARITIVLDACFSGGATKSGASKYSPKSVSSEIEPAGDKPGEDVLKDLSLEELDDARQFVSLKDNRSRPGIVVLSATKSGKFAYASPDGSLFTMSLVEAAERRLNMTYEQLTSELTQVMRKYSQRQEPQVLISPTMKTRPFLGDSSRTAPVGLSFWTITDIEGGNVQLSGLPFPGFGPGARLTVLESSQWDDTDGARDGAPVIEIAEFYRNRGEATARIIEPGNSGSIEVGQLAAITSPSPDSETIRLGIPKNTSEAGQRLLDAVEGKINALLGEDDGKLYGGLISVENSEANFELRLSENNDKIQLLDVESFPRAVYEIKRKGPEFSNFDRIAASIMSRLIGFSRQEAIRSKLALVETSQPDADPIDIHLVWSDTCVDNMPPEECEALRRYRCYESLPPDMHRSPIDQAARVPEGRAFVIEARWRHPEQAPNGKRHVAGSILSWDGRLLGFPQRPSDLQTLSANSPCVAYHSDTFKIGKGPDVIEDVLILTRRDPEQIPWSLLDTDYIGSVKGSTPSSVPDPTLDNIAIQPYRSVPVRGN